ncbi:MAG: ABC transporter permease subunit [Pseudomonadota bacterium]
MTEQASAPPSSTLSLLTVEQSQRLARIRRAKDLLARGTIMLGGFGVIAAILLIFFYLLWEVMPLFRPSSMEPAGTYSLPATASDDGRTLLLAVEEQNEVGFRFTPAGELVFFEVPTGKVVRAQRIAHADVAAPTALAAATPGGETLAVGYADGSALIVHETYRVTWPDDVKTVEAEIEYPYGETPTVLFPADAAGTARAVAQLAVRTGDDGYTLAARAADGAVVVSTVESQEDMMTGEISLTESERREFSVPGPVQALHFNNDGWFLFAVLADGRVQAWDLRETAPPMQEVRLDGDAKFTASAMLLGNVSLLVGDDGGRITQLFMVRDAQNRYRLTAVRTLKLSDAPVVQIVPEQRRKSFAAIDADGTAGFISTTAERLALAEKVAAGGSTSLSMAVSPRGDRLLVIDGRDLHVKTVHNEHPDVSWSALWSKVWYEGYDEPKYIWQSSAANNDFEPKFSLTPLAYGTLKAAIFAMILAMPLAICGAIFTAYFMAPRLRTMVKPTIELMAALPTVILGFLAGLWLAPLFESALPAVFTMLIVTPLFIVLAAILWQQMPERVRLAVPDGWEPILLVPVIALAVALPFMTSGWMETAFFGGDVRVWLTQTLDIPFDQRNALVVGFAMGFAVIPTIYSIAEDALFEVPKHLTQGSLALGATPWQTMMRVVLPTASPGIFSAVMIGFGRAVGETMIVLMATGNTPVMTMNIFEGFRTLSANIAVEMPESEVGSTHFRILFLAALVLFLFTFLVNTTAEIVRQRLRRKYGTL